ncbi:MAG TPA: MFS transporter [Pseudonocardia sp.]|uniref:MFS transporter n=1 Tax=Pseudonocardia sp. TaxID=60912 RepID=UPI002F42DF96
MTRAEARPTAPAAISVACLALFTDMLVYGLAIPVLPLLPSVVAAGPTATGALFAAYAAATLAVTPLAGRLVDRVGPRRPLLLGLFGLAAATVLFAVGGQYWVLLVARALQGLAAGLGWVAGLSLIAAVTSPATRGRSMGLAMSMVSVGLLVGPPLAGLLVERFGVRAPFLFAAGLAVLDGVARLVLVRGLAAAEAEPGGPRAVLRMPGAWPVLVAVLLGAGTLAAVEPVLPLHLTLRFGMDALRLGLLFAALVLVSAAISPVAGALVGRVDARALTSLGIGVSALALAVLGAAQQEWQVWLGMVLLGAGEAGLLAPATTLIAELGGRARPAALGAAYALFNLAYAAGLMVGPLLAGAGTGALGFAVTLFGLALLTAVTGAVSVRRLPTGR